MASSTDPADFVVKHLDGLASVLTAMPADKLAEAIKMLEQARSEDRQVLIAGNGGSASTASHMAADLMKTVAQNGGRSFRIIALTDNVPLLTAFGNDVGFDEIFSGQLSVLGRKGDVLVVISGSGNSANIVKAVETARDTDIRTIGFLGMGGGKVAEMVDVSVVVPSDKYAYIEDAHLAMNHLIATYFANNAGHD